MTHPLFQNHDAPRAVATRIVRDRETGLPVIVTRQATQQIVDDNKRTAGMFDKQASRGKPRMVANIPAVVWLRLMKLGITRDRRALLKWLSRRDARFFRTDDGRPLA
jgi:hypothetical protein